MRVLRPLPTLPSGSIEPWPGALDGRGRVLSQSWRASPPDLVAARDDERSRERSRGVESDLLDCVVREEAACGCGAGFAPVLLSLAATERRLSDVPDVRVGGREVLESGRWAWTLRRALACCSLAAAKAVENEDSELMNEVMRFTSLVYTAMASALSSMAHAVRKSTRWSAMWRMALAC